MALSRNPPKAPRNRLISKPATEERNPASEAIDGQSTRAILCTIQSQDAQVPVAVRAQIPQIARVVDAAVRALSRGGRLVYVGAGTSGRLGVLDAAECPPTFGVPPRMVRAVLAGGTRALLRAVEAAEDDAGLGRRDMAREKVGPRDVVIGLTASGSTPYTLGALAFARSRRATTAVITSNAHSPAARAAQIVIAPATGAEVIAGSTRMKAALAQKMILNMISTATMVRLGRVYQNYMVGVRPTNRKLVQRACGILSAITGADGETSDAALRAAHNDVPAAILMLRRGLSYTAARQQLRKHGGNLRALV